MYDYRFLYDQVFLLELTPVLLKQLETSLYRSHVFGGHAKFEVVNEEAEFMSAVDRVLIYSFFFVAFTSVAFLLL